MKRIKFQRTLNPSGHKRVESIPEDYERRSVDTAYDELLGFVVLEVFENEDYSHSFIRYTYQLAVCEGCTETRRDSYIVWDIESYDLYTALRMAYEASFDPHTSEVVINGR